LPFTTFSVSKYVKDLLTMEKSACATSVLRLYYSIKLELTGDVSYDIALVGVWAVAENSIGILCCCLPVFPLFFQVIGPQVASVAKTGFSKNTLKISKETITSRKRSTGGSKSDSGWIATHKPQSSLVIHGTYKTLEDGHEMFQVGNREFGNGARVDAVPRHDERGIRKTQTFGIVSTPIVDENVDVEAQAQHQIDSAQMGW